MPVTNVVGNRLFFRDLFQSGPNAAAQTVGALFNHNETRCMDGLELTVQHQLMIADLFSECVETAMKLSSNYRESGETRRIIKVN